MAGRDVDIVATRHRSAQHEAVRVNRQCLHLPGAQCKGIARIRITGVFHADAGLFAYQQHGQQERRLLRPVGDQYLVAVGPDAARRQQTPVDLVDQGVVVAVDVVGRPLAD